MNEEALNDAYALFKGAGYNKSIEDFKQLLKTNNEALQDAHKLFVDNGYNKSVDDFASLIGVIDTQKKNLVDGTSPMEPMDSTLPQEGTSGLSESEELVETEVDVADQFEGMPLFKEDKESEIAKKLEANTRRVGSSLSRIPVFLAEQVFTLTASEEQKDFVNSLPADQRETFLAQLVSSTTPSGDFAPVLTKFSQEQGEKIKEIEDTYQQYETSIGQDFANLDLGQAMDRTFTEVVGGAPQLVQAMIPVVGLASIAVGSAAAKSGELQREGEDLGLRTSLNSIVSGTAEGVFEIVTRKLGKKLLDSFKVNPEETIQTFGQKIKEILVDSNLEGASELATTITQSASDALIQGKDVDVMDVIREAIDAYIIGGGTGGSLTGFGKAYTTTKQAAEKNRLSKKIKGTKYNSIEDVFAPITTPEGDLGSQTDIDQTTLDIASSNVSRKFVVEGLNRSVKRGDLTREQADSRLNDFDKIRAADKRVGEEVSGENRLKAVDLIREKQTITQEIAGVEPALVEGKKERLEEIDNELKEIANAVQEQETREVPDAEQAEGVQEVEGEVRGPDVETEESIVIDETELSELEAEVLDAESEGTIDENLGEVVYMDDGTPGMLQIDPDNENTYSIVTNDNIIEVGLKSEDGGSKTLAEIGVSKFPPEGVKTETKTAKETTAVSIDGVEYDIIGRRRDKKGQAVVKVKEKKTGLIRRFKGEKAERILKDVSLQEDAPTPSIDLRTEGKEVVSKKKKDEVENFTEQQLQEEIDRVERESKEFEESLEKDIEAEEALDRKLMFSTRTGDVSVTRNTDGSYRVSKKSPSGKYIALREKTERENAIREYEKIRKERGDKRLSDAVELAQEFKKEQDDKVVSWLDKQISATSTKGKAFDAVRGIPQFMLHEGLKMVKSAYLAGKSLKQAVDDSIKFIKSQGYSVNEIQYKKAILDGLKEPQRVQGKQPKRDENKVSDEKPKKAAPSARKVTGQPKRKKVTVDEYASLKDQIKLEAKAARESVTAYKNAGKKIAEAVKALGGKGKLTVRQANTVANKILRTNLTNDKQVKGLLEYLEKIYQRAELSDMIVNARKRKKRAKANLKSKVGPDGVLLGKLRDMVSLDPTDIPLDLLPEYADFMDRLGASSKVLDLPQKRDALDLATRILERVGDSFDNTLTETSSPKDYNLDEAVKEIQSEKIDVSNISNPDAKKLAEFINGLTKKDIEGLVTESKDGKKDYSKVENLKSLKREMNKGYAPSFAFEVKTKVESNRVVDNLSGRPLANTNIGTNVLNFLDRKVYGTIKGLLRGTKAIEEVLRATAFVGTSLDNALGNYNRSDFRRQVVDRIATAYESLTNDFRSIREDYLERAEYVLSRNGIEMRDNNSILKSKYKIQTFLLQLEFLSNMKLDKDGVNTNTQVAPAIGFINKTIDKMKSEEGVLKDGRIKILEEIRDEFSENGEISIEKIEQSLSDGEKEATYLIQQAYSQTNEKYQYLASVVRGEGVKPLNNYVHHNVMYDKARDEKDSMSEKSKKFVSASTKSGTVLQRTPGAKAINFDPISSASKGINEMLTDYHMTEPVKVALSITNKLKSIEGLSKNQQNAMNALDNVLKESLDKVFMNTMTSNTVFDKFLQAVDKYGYYAALASVPRAGAELGSNFVGALTMSPKTFTTGIANFGNFSMGQNVEGFLRAVQSSSINKLAPESGSLGKFGDGTTFSKGERASSAMNPVLNKVDWLAKNARTPQLRKLLDAVPEKLLMTPDLAISRPVFFQSFADKFQELTGKKLTVEDYIAIANGDMSSIEGNMDAVADARDFADTQVKRLAASANPFEKPLKNIIGVDDSGIKKVYKRANSYMANFFAFEFNTASEAVVAIFNSGEISRRQAFGLLGMVGARMSTYLVTYKVLSSLFDNAISELFGIDIGEEEEEDLLGMSIRQSIGSAATLMLRRRMGSLSSLPAMYGLEYVNEEYLQELRDGEDYDSYKHGLAFTPIPRDELSKMNPAEALFMTLSGPQGPMLKSGLRAAKLMQRGSEEAMDELEDRMILEGAGNVNLIPFYKDIRRILLKNQFKDYGKESLWKDVEREKKEYEKREEKRNIEQNKFIKSFNKGFENDGFKGGGFKGGGFKGGGF